MTIIEQFVISQQVEASSDKLGVFADMVEVAFNAGLELEGNESQTNPYLLLVGLYGKLGNMSETMLNVLDEDDPSEQMIQVQKDLYHAMAYLLVMQYRLRNNPYEQQNIEAS